MNRIFLYIFTPIFVCGLLLIFISFGFRKSAPGGFKRSFLSGALTNVKAFYLKENSYYIAGLSKDAIFLGDYLTPDLLVTSNYALADTHHIQLTIPEKQRSFLKALRAYVSYPSVYLYEGISPSIYYCQLPERKCQRINDSIPNFTDFVPLSSSSYILKTFDNTSAQNVLTKKYGWSLFHNSNNALQRQRDGVFSVEGQLLYNPDISTVVQVYRYRNLFTELDTNLNVLSNGKTIDTISFANFELDTIGGKEITFKYPPVTVNTKSAVSKNFLFISSGVIAENEGYGAFESNTVIDVYTISDHRYKYSFYIPEFKNGKMYDFKVFDNKIVALYPHHLVVYNLNK